MLLVSRAGGDRAPFETLMRQHNRTLFRVARVILKDDSEAEAALQEAYVAAYPTLMISGDDSSLSTRFIRIVVDESLGRLKKRRRDSVVIRFPPAGHRENRTSSEDATLRAEMRALLEKKLDELPLALRIVFVMRELEEMTVEETAECLGISEATVRSRLSRAKSLFRTLPEREVDLELRDVFAFGGERCERIVAAVLARITKDANRN
jgi:RNA polymerase sigma-70 factor (ECF subfamily)